MTLQAQHPLRRRMQQVGHLHPQAQPQLYVVYSCCGSEDVMAFSMDDFKAVSVRLFDRAPVKLSDAAPVDVSLC